MRRKREHRQAGVLQKLTDDPDLRRQAVDIWIKKRHGKTLEEMMIEWQLREPLPLDWLREGLLTNG